MHSLSWTVSTLSIWPIQCLTLASTSLEIDLPRLDDLVEELAEIVFGPRGFLVGLGPGGGNDLIQQIDGFDFARGGRGGWACSALLMRSSTLWLLKNSNVKTVAGSRIRNNAGQRLIHPHSWRMRL